MSISLAAAALVALTPLAAIPSCAAAQHGASVEVTARIWQEGNAEFASVSLNGRELVTFKGEPGDAAERAEEFAAKLQEIVQDKDFDAEDLVPGRAGASSALQLQGSNVLTFETAGACESGKEIASPFDLSFRVVNKIRTAFGSTALNANLLRIIHGGNEGEHTAMGAAFSGKASWYGPGFHGRRASDGSRFDQEKLTAAHRSLPFGTKLLVMNRKTGDSCIVQINDRGPYVDGRVIDLSRGAARQLNMLSAGVTAVDCVVLGSD